MSKYLAAVLMAATAVSPLAAQWDDSYLQEKALPTGADGKFDPEAPIRRLADGKPDLSGTWMVPDIQTLGWNIANDLEEGGPPRRPWVTRLVRERRERDLIDDPSSRCFPAGMLGLHLISPFRIAMLEDRVLILFEQNTTFRQIFLDGRKPAEDLDPTYMGHSAGHWEGDTLVVETRGFNGISWIDADGHPVTEQLRLTERFRRPAFGRMEVAMTFDDPSAYTKPWTVVARYGYLANSEVTESFCTGNVFNEQLKETGLTATEVAPQEPPTDLDEAALAAELALEDAQLDRQLATLLEGIPLQKTATGRKLVLEDDMFDSAGALKPAAMPDLVRIGDALKQLRQVRATIRAYSDGQSDEQIILKRSHAVRQVFIDRGAAILQPIPYSLGDRSPVASNATAEGRTKNRRVEITIGR